MRSLRRLGGTGMFTVSPTPVPGGAGPGCHAGAAVPISHVFVLYAATLCDHIVDHGRSASWQHPSVRTGSCVFDPPPAALTVPWPYLATVTATLLAAIVAVTTVTIRIARTPPPRVLREL